MPRDDYMVVVSGTYSLVGQLQQRLVVDGGNLLLGPVVPNLCGSDSVQEGLSCIFFSFLLNVLLAVGDRGRREGGADSDVVVDHGGHASGRRCPWDSREEVSG